jgi:uncharacterized protein (TIGR00369 family)
LNLDFSTDGSAVKALYRPRAEHVGFKQTVHGGILATLLDEAMVWACGVKTGRFAFCAEFTVRFLRPVRPGEEITVIGELAQNRRDKLFEARGELRNPDQEQVAVATGKYIPVPEETLSPMLDDFVGDIGLVFPHLAARR